MRAILTRLPALIAAALAVCVLPCAGGDEPATADRQQAQQPGVATLLEQLNDPRMLVRVAAERSLRQRGPAVLEELPDPATLKAPAADAVRRIRTDLQRAQAQAALEAGRVTLGGETSLADVVQSISEQTGNRIDASELPESVRKTQIRVDVAETTFWDAVSEIERRADVVATCDPNEDRVLLRATTDVASPPLSSTNDGAFRISVITVREQMDFVNPDRRLLRSVLEVLVEPRLRPLFLHVSDGEVLVAAADDDNDDETDDDDDANADNAKPTARPLAPLSPKAKREIPLERPGPIRITYDVVLPQGNLGPPLEAVDIAGRFEMELAAGEERFEFRHLDEPGRITRRHGGVSVTLESLTHDDGVIDVQLRLRYDADGPSFESHRSWVFHNEAWLSTGEGGRLEPAEFETLSEGEGGAQLRYRFTGIEGISADMQLNYTAPTLFARVPISFELQDVPANR
jgi:hypothetical protein